MADEFSKKSLVFLHWLRSRGTTISDKIDLRDLRDRLAGRGVVANGDIDEDEILFSIPRTSILTVESSGLTANLTNTLDPWLALILAMTYEFQKGTNSPWQPYFAVLPERFDTLMFWSESNLSHLEGSAVLKKIGKDDAEELFKKQITPIIKDNAEMFHAHALSDEDLLALCHRMGSTIMAYAFDVEKAANDGAGEPEEDGWEEGSDAEEQQPKGMIPLADMLNADAGLNSACLFYEDDSVVMRSIRPIKAGQEIFNDYGPLPRADLLRRYGYVTERYAEYDVVEVSQKLVAETVKELGALKEHQVQERLAYVDDQGVLDNGYDIARVDSEDGPFPEQLCVLLNTLMLDHEAFEKLKKKDKLPKPELSQGALGTIARLLVKRRAEYAVGRAEADGGTLNSLETHPSDLSQHDGKRRRILALPVIAGEKEVLQEAYDFVHTKLGGKTDGKRKANTFEDEAIAEHKKRRSG